MSEFNAATAFLANWQQARPFEMQPGVLSNFATEALARIPELNAKMGAELAAVGLQEAGALRRQELASKWAYKTSKLPYEMRPKSSLADKLMAIRSLQQGLGGGRAGRRATAADMLANAGGLISSDPLAQARGVQNTVLGSMADMGITTLPVEKAVEGAWKAAGGIQAPYSSEVPVPTPVSTPMPDGASAAVTPVERTPIPAAQSVTIADSGVDYGTWLASERKRLGLDRGASQSAG